MHVANIWEQVMLYLEIQTADIPVKDTVIVSKIGSSQKLMDSPAVFHFTFFVRHRIFSAIDHVGRLKNNCQDETTYVVHDNKTENSLPPCNGKDDSRQDHDVANIKYFGS